MLLWFIEKNVAYKVRLHGHSKELMYSNDVTLLQMLQNLWALLTCNIHCNIFSTEHCVCKIYYYFPGIHNRIQLR